MISRMLKLLSRPDIDPLDIVIAGFVWIAGTFYMVVVGSLELAPGAV